MENDPPASRTAGLPNGSVHVSVIILAARETVRARLSQDRRGPTDATDRDVDER